MKHYNRNGELMALSDQDIKRLGGVPDGWIEVSDEEVKTHHEYGTFTPTQEDIDAYEQRQRQKLFAKFTRQIANFIQKEVDKFNAQNGTLFQSIHSVGIYAHTNGYYLQEQCQELWNWSVIEVWQNMRQWQSTLDSIPTDEEFMAKLKSHARV